MICTLYAVMFADAGGGRPGKVWPDAESAADGRPWIRGVL